MACQLARADCAEITNQRGNFPTIAANTTGHFQSITGPSHDKAFAARPAVNQCRTPLDLDWIYTNEALAGTSGYLRESVETVQVVGNWEELEV